RPSYSAPAPTATTCPAFLPSPTPRQRTATPVPRKSHCPCPFAAPWYAPAPRKSVWSGGQAMMMYVFIGTGFTGALTLVFLIRVLLRRLGYITCHAAFFSPKGGCQEAIVKEIKAARREILVQAYSFTADPLTFGL